MLARARVRPSGAVTADAGVTGLYDPSRLDPSRVWTSFDGVVLSAASTTNQYFTNQRERDIAQIRATAETRIAELTQQGQTERARILAEQTNQRISTLQGEISGESSGSGGAMMMLGLGVLALLLMRK